MENNTTIMNAVWLEASDDFQQRIPDPSQVGIAATTKALFEPFNRPLLNQFMSIFINKIAYGYVHNKVFDNPFSVFKRQPLEYGQTVQEAALKFIQAHSYRDDWGTRADDIENLLKVHRPDGSVAYHTVNREDTYPISINTMELRGAFNSEMGLNNLLSAIMQVPYNSDNYDEYRIFLELLAFYEEHHGFFKQQVSAVTDEATAKAFLKQVRAYAGKLRFPSSLYNALSVKDIPVWINPDEADELVLITDPDTLASIDVDALAALFNVDKAELKYRTLIVDRIPIPGAVALLTTADFFVCADYAYETTSFFNAQTLTENYYLHHIGMYSVSPFVPAILFTTEAGTDVPTVTLNATGFSLVDGDGNSVHETLMLPPETDVEIPLTASLIGTLSADPVDTELMSLAVAPDSFTWDIATQAGYFVEESVEPVPYAYDPTKIYIDQNLVLHIKRDGVPIAVPSPVSPFTDLELTDFIVFVEARSAYVNPDGTTPDLRTTYAVPFQL